jgi:hypothetical protein
MNKRRLARLFVALILALLAGLWFSPRPIIAEEPSFGEPRLVGPAPDGANHIAVGDMNGDRHLDVIVARNGENTVYLNDGSGYFDWPGAARPFGNGFTWRVAVGDMNADGALDIVAGDRGGQNVVYLNDGAGNFDWPGAAIPFSASDDETYDLALGDLDGDNDLDIVVGNEGQNYFALNNGASSFSAYKFGLSTTATSSVVLADVDGNGRLDIIVGNQESVSSGHSGQDYVYLNDGSLEFLNVRTYGTHTDWPRDVTTGDIDGDSDMDIISGNLYGDNVIYLNDGAGNFSDYGANIPNCNDFEIYCAGSGTTEGIAVGDVDGERDP